MQEKIPTAKKSIKILHIINSLSVGGAEMKLYRLLSSMDSSRFENAVISLLAASDLTHKIEDLGIRVYHLEMRGRIPSIKTIYRLKQKIQSLQPNIIQGWMYHGNLAACFVHILYRKRTQLIWNIVHSLHAMDHEKRMTKWIIRLGPLLSRFTDHIIYNAEMVRKQHQAIGYPMKNSIVIANGFDVKKFTSDPEAHNHLCKKLGVSNNTIFIGLVGRYHPIKGHTDFIEAAQFFKGTDVHFVMAGRNVDESNDILIKKISTLGLKKQFHLLGEDEDVPKLQAALDIATSSSHGEAFSNVIGEAMACSVPCVVTDVGDSAKIVNNTGIVVPPKNPDALAKGWKKILEMSSEEQKSLGDKAHQRIIENYTLVKFTKRFEELYERVISNRNHSRKD